MKAANPFLSYLITSFHGDLTKMFKSCKRLRSERKMYTNGYMCINTENRVAVALLSYKKGLTNKTIV